MNDLSPPDASVALAPTVSPGPAEPLGSESAEPPAEAAPSEPPPTSEADPDPEPESAATVAPPPFAPSAALETLSQTVFSAPAQLPASASIPAPDAFAVPLVSEEDPCGPDLDLEGD